MTDRRLPKRREARAAAPVATVAVQQGRVVAAFGRKVEVRVEASGERVKCAAHGRRMEAVCGDRVAISRAAEGHDASQGMIESIDTRTSVLFRRDAMREKVIAANVTLVAYVVAGEPPFSDELLSRCLIAANAAGIEALIVLNKTDLPESTAVARGQLAPFAALGYPVQEVAARQDVEALRARLAGHDSLLIGQSGMGKSTLVNALVPDAGARTGEISSALDAGRHTPTASRLYALQASGTVIDSPGLQAFGLAHVPTDRLAAAFPEFAPLIGSCRFANCRHQSEPGCAVRAAFGRGAIDPRRMRIYDTLLEEGEYTARRALHGGS
ncbi:MAG: ribosome small subunit-dependent GTPase A [bacterium]